jgi:uncharacterized protein (TIGR03437 family)
MYQRLFLLFLPFLAAAQTIPIRLGDAINLIPPAISADGSTVVFAAAMAPDGTPQKATNLYLFSQGPTPATRRLTNYSGNATYNGDATWVGPNSISYSAGFAAYTAAVNWPGGTEEVHLIDITSAADRTLATDKLGCIQPACANCARPCVGPVHLTADGSKVLYAVARDHPFFVLNANGSGLKGLPVYQGSLAQAPKRVIGAGGILVFTSSAPSGPTFAAAATDVYTINLDGTGLRQVTKFGSATFYAGNATISADGAWIAFEANFSVTQTWIVRPDGTGLRQVSGGSDAATSTSISADGSMVTFVQGGQIKRVQTTVEGTTPLALTSLGISMARDATVSGDGTGVVFSLGPPYVSGAALCRIPTDAPSDARSFLSIYAPRFLNANGVVSAAGTGAPSPGSLLSAYGVNLGADELVQATTFPLPTSMSGLSLLVNGTAVPLLAVTRWQINAQLPQGVPAGPATFQVRDASGATAPPVSVTVESSAPVNFWYPFVQGQLYYPQAAAYHAGTGVAADMDHPASAGEALEIYGLGLGVTEPVVEAGLPSPSSPPARAVQVPRLQIGGRDAVVTFAGLAPGFAGVYQVNAVVPAGLAPGVQNVAWPGPGGAVSYSSVAVK